MKPLQPEPVLATVTCSSFRSNHHHTYTLVAQHQSLRGGRNSDQLQQMQPPTSSWRRIALRQSLTSNYYFENVRRCTIVSDTSNHPLSPPLYSFAHELCTSSALLHAAYPFMARTRQTDTLLQMLHHILFNIKRRYVCCTRRHGVHNGRKLFCCTRTDEQQC